MNNLTTLADNLLKAYRGTAIAPLRHQCDDLSIETAYSIQELNTKAMLANGAELVGRKIGLTSEAVQKQLGVDQPDYGMLWKHKQYGSSDSLSVSDFLQPKVEAEIAFVLKHDLTEMHLTIEEMAHAVDYALPALEIVDSRIADWDIILFDTIADNASYGAHVLGMDRVSLDCLDLVNCKMQLKEDEQVISEGVGSACLGNPLHAALWLAKVMVEAGRPLLAGDIVLSGALGPMHVMQADKVYHLAIEGFEDLYFKTNV